MTTENPSLIKLDGVTKVFLTDEVETHALSGIHMDIRKGEYVSIAGPSGSASPPCSQSSACSTRRPTALTSSTAAPSRA